MLGLSGGVAQVGLFFLGCVDSSVYGQLLFLFGETVVSQQQ